MKIRILNITKYVNNLKLNFYLSKSNNIIFKINFYFGFYEKYLNNCFIFLNLLKKRIIKFYLLDKQRFNSFFFSVSRIVYGISNGFFIELILVGLGYKLNKIKNYLFLDLNYSHKIYYKIPKGIFLRCSKKKILLFSIDKCLLYNTAKIIKNFRIPNRYKGTGIRFLGEKIRLKPGKQR